MLSIVTCTVLCFIIFCVLCRNEVTFYIAPILWLSFAVGGLSGLIMSCSIGSTYPHKNYKEVTESYPLVAFANTTNYAGSFLLIFGCGGGGTNSEVQYKYIVDTARGMQLQTSTAGKGDGVYVKEVNNVKPHMERVKEGVRVEVPQKFWTWGLDPKAERDTLYRVFYVPKGTVVREFKLDAQR